MKYKDSNGIALLTEYGYREASLISDINDPEYITFDYFQKGADAVCVPQYQSVQTDEECTIFDCSSLRTLRKAGRSKQHYAGK